MNEELIGSSPLPLQQKAAKKTLIDSCCISGFLLVLTLLALMAQRSAAFGMWVLALVAGLLFLYSAWESLRLFGLYRTLQGITKENSQEQTVSCRKVHFIGAEERRLNTKLVAIVLEGKEKFVYVLPQRKLLTAKSKKEYLDRFAGKSVTLSCYEGTNTVKEILS